MAEAAIAQTSFYSGEWSQTMGGRFDRPDYKQAMNVCLNGIIMEQGTWTRRPGTNLGGMTRNGNPGRLIDFDIIESFPYNMEFTDGFLRFWALSLVLNNDMQTVTAITDVAGTAVFAVANAWATGAAVVASGLLLTNPQIQGRVLNVTNLSSTTFSLTDPFTNTAITYAQANVSGFSFTSVQQLATPYLSGTWSNIISVQTEEQSVLLNGAEPQVLTMDTPPNPTAAATFSIAPINLLDGPYLDPYPGSQVTYSALSGNITLTFSFVPYSAITSYDIGDYVTSSGQGYISLQNANLNHTPSSSPTYWATVNGGAPVGPNGFTAGDIGRSIRLFSTPPLWAAASTYSINNVVTYNGAYYQSLINSNTGNTPETAITDWALVTGAGYALWTWGRIIAISGSGLIANSGSYVGNMTGNGGLAAAFNSTPSQNMASSATLAGSVTNPNGFTGGAYNAGNQVTYLGNIYQCIHSFSVVNGFSRGTPSGYYQYNGNYGYFNGLTFVFTSYGAAVPTNGNFWSYISPAASLSVDGYVGQYYSSAKVIQQVTIYPSDDQGFAASVFDTLTINLWASNSSPSSPSNGTLLGSTVLTSNQLSSVTLNSNSTASWMYVWVELIAYTSGADGNTGSGTFNQTIAAGQVEFFAPNVNNGSVVTIELVGPALLYPTGTVISTWAAGAFSNEAGWPTCGCYEGGRLWLAGRIPNRFDASNSDDIFNFAPTGPDGTVGDSNAISYTLNDQGVNPILWMQADAQGIICGTQEREWLIFATTLNAPLTPTTTDARPVTKLGCANTIPARTEHTLVFIQKSLRKVVEYFADVFSGKFTAPDLHDKARHLTIGQLAEVKYQHEITPTIWCRNADGTWMGGTYKRDTLMTSQGPTFMGWHRHLLGSGRIPSSFSVGASEGGTLDALSMVTHDGTPSPYWVEMVGDIFEETSVINNANFLDASLTPTSYFISGGFLVLNGLWLLNGQTVQAWCGGLDAGQSVTTTASNNVTTTVITDFTVKNGSISIPLDDFTGTSSSGLLTTAYVNSFATMPISVGFTFTSQGQLMRPLVQQETRTATGPALGMKRKIARTAFLLNNAQGLQWGTDFTKMRAMNLKDAGGNVVPPQTLYSGVFYDTIECDWSFDGRISWQITRPYPATVCAVEGKLTTSE